MDYTGNSRKQRDNENNPEEKKIEKVVTGEVVQKPKSIGYKFRSIFFGGNDFKTSATFVIQDVFWPAVRNLGYDMMMEYGKQIFFREGDPRRRADDYRRQGPRIRYDRTPISPRRDFRDPAYLPDQPRFRPVTPRREFNDVAIPTRGEAELVLERLNDIIDKYEVATLADYYDLLGEPSAHTDQKWGWNYLVNVPIRQVREGYLIELPTLQEI